MKIWFLETIKMTFSLYISSIQHVQARGVPPLGPPLNKNLPGTCS
jgi:hypothetical protein